MKDKSEHNMGWDCECTNYHACEYHKEVSLYRGCKDFGRLPVSKEVMEKAKGFEVDDNE